MHHVKTQSGENFHKGLVDARVPGKRNQYREGSKNQHFLFARVAYREEFVSQFREMNSCDDMNKIRMGPQEQYPDTIRSHGFSMVMILRFSVIMTLLTSD